MKSSNKKINIKKGNVEWMDKITSMLMNTALKLLMVLSTLMGLYGIPIAKEYLLFIIRVMKVLHKICITNDQCESSRELVKMVFVILLGTLIIYRTKNPVYIKLLKEIF